MSEANEKKIKKPKIDLGRKTRLCIFVLVLALIISLIVLFLECVDFNLRRGKAEIEEEMTHYWSFKLSQDLLKDAFESFDDIADVTTADLTASMIDKSSSGEPGNVRMYEDGCIFRYDGKKSEFPRGLPKDMDVESIKPDKETGGLRTADAENGAGKYKPYDVFYSKIHDDLYYMEWKEKGAHDERSIADKVDWGALSDYMVDSYGIDFILTGKAEDGNAAVESATGPFEEYQDIRSMGISWNRVKNSMDHSLTPVVVGGKFYLMKAADLKSLAEKNGADKKALDYVDEQSGAVIAMMPLGTMVLNTSGNIMTFQLLMLMICIALIMWTISTYKTIIAGELTDKEIPVHSPKSIRSKVVTFIVISSILIGVGCAYSYSLNRLFDESKQLQATLGSVIKTVNTGEAGSRKVWSAFKSKYSHNAEKIAAELEKNPDLMNSEWLQEASDIIGADYIILYDSKGREIITNARYRNLSLGEDENSATYVFRRLLKGVKAISRDGVSDEVTGLTRDMYGVSFKYAGSGDNGYGALIIAAEPGMRAVTDILDINAVLDDYTLKNSLSFAAEPENGTVEYSSDTDLVGKSLLGAGFDEKNLKSSFIGFFTLYLKEWFGRSAENDGLLYYYAADERKMYSGAGGYTLVCIVLFLLIIIPIALILLKGFNDAVYDHYLDIGDPDTENDSSPRIGKQVIRKIASAVGMEGSPLHKTMVTMLLFAVLCLAFLAARSILAGGGSENTNSSVIRYVMTGDWERGANIFSATAIFFVFCAVVLVEAVLYLIRVTLRNVLSARGMTISALVTSLLQYLVLFAAVFISLGYLGVDYKAMLASVGILGMAVSFGAKDFVADIFAGANLLIDNTYQMGDIVDINGYTGTIRELTLRTTKMEGSGGNIKTIRNSDINNVINLSAMDSWYPMELLVSSDQNIKEMEDILIPNLPKIGAKYDEILRGPEYRGIESIGGGKMTILVLTSCSQSNYYKVQRIVNKELLRLFAEHGINIL